MKELALPAFVEVTKYTKDFIEGYETRLNISKIYSFHSTDQLIPKSLFKIIRWGQLRFVSDFEDEHRELCDDNKLVRNEHDDYALFVPIKEKTIIIAYGDDGKRKYYFSDLPVNEFEKLCSTPPALREYLEELKTTEERLDKKIARFQLMDLE